MAFKAFVSSTFRDLKEHRARVVDELRKAGFLVDSMEDWTASTDAPMRFSQDRLDGCDLCVLLVALRRGYVPQGESLSITQLEYQAALDRDIDVLVFMVDEHAPWPRQFDELDKDPEMRPWRARLMEERGVGFFEDEPESIEIASALTRWLRDHMARPPVAPPAAAPPAVAPPAEAGGLERPVVAPLARPDAAMSAVASEKRFKPWMAAAGVAAALLLLLLVLGGGSEEPGAPQPAENSETQPPFEPPPPFEAPPPGVQPPSATEQANWTVLEEQVDALLEGLSETVGEPPDDQPMHAFAPALYARGEDQANDGLDAWEEGRYEQALERLGDAVEILEQAWGLAEVRAEPWQAWHGFVNDYASRPLGGAAGRFIGARFTVTGDVAQDGSISALVRVEYWCKSENETRTAAGKFQVSGATLDDLLTIRCPRGSEKDDAEEYVLTEEVLLDYHPSQISVSRDSAA